jgi:hypothetical protein
MVPSLSLRGVVAVLVYACVAAIGWALGMLIMARL